jgi:hypothetical protein
MGGELIAGGLLALDADGEVVLDPQLLAGGIPADRLEIEVGDLVHDLNHQMPTDHHRGK